MFRRILHHPHGEFLSPGHNYHLIVILLHCSQSIRYIICFLSYLQLLEQYLARNGKLHDKIEMF